MKGKRMAMYAAVAGIIAGGSAIAGGLYAHWTQPIFGYPQFFGMKWDQGFSGVGMLVGLGIIMLAGGFISFKWPSVGATIVCLGAIVGLIYTYDRGMYRWVPLVYYWWAPWLFAWIAGIFAGLSMSQRVQQLGAQEDGAVERS